MSCSINASLAPECTWTVQNWVFRWFVHLISQKYASDNQLTSALKLATYTNGVSLDLVYEEDKDLAVRMRDAFRLVAGEIAAGNHKLPDSGQSQSQRQEECQRVFAKLALMLEQCELRPRIEAQPKF
jgi:hypothetical protein